MRFAAAPGMGPTVFDSLSKSLALAAVVATALVSAASAQQNRIDPGAARGRRVALAGQVHPRVAVSTDQGRLDPSTRISNVTLAFAPTAEQQAALDLLLSDQQNPASPRYHQWLTPERYADQFGLSQGDLGTVRAWLESQGLTVNSVARSRAWISVSGSAAQVETAFQTELHQYLDNGETHFANATAPTVPERFTPVIRAIRGLNDFRPRPFAHILRPANGGGAVKSNYTSSRGNHYVAPDDLAVIYNFKPLYDAGITGSGQKIVIAGQTGIRLTDIQQFRSEYGLPASDPQTVLVPGATDPGIVKNDVDEAHLDIEWSGATARNATIVYVYANDVFDAVQYAIDQNYAPVVSTSYGACELAMTAGDAASMRASAQQANAQGITWFSASGDTGAADCAYINNGAAAVDFPGSMPEVTSVGGTEFQEGTGTYWNTTNTTGGASALSYIPEIVWNDSVQDGTPSASGGGSSVFYAKPSWQTGAGVPGDNARHVPDISMAASADHDGYLVYSGGDYVFGGTSVPAPIYAGLAALLNQRMLTTGKVTAPGLGNINPGLYALAQTSSGIFHDITTGDNIVTVTCPARSRSCIGSTTVGFSAGAGYDLATGLGSVDAYRLVTGWTGATISVPETRTELTLQTSVSLLGAADTIFLIASAKSTDGSTPTGTVTFTQGSTALGTADLAGAGGVATATLAVAGSKLSQGSGTISAALNGSTTASITVTVNGTGSAAAKPAISSALNGASFQAAAAPGAILSVFGSQLALTTNVASAVPLPLSIDGVAATVNGIAAPIWYVSPGQINLQIPYQVQAGSATLVINNNGQTSTSTLNITATAPGIFTDSSSNLVPASSAARGSTIALYITGAGAVTPAIANGAAPDSSATVSQLPVPAAYPTVTIGGVDAPVAFAGVPVGVVGVIQLNVQVPSGAPTGQQPVMVTSGGTSSAAAKLVVQ